MISGAGHDAMVMASVFPTAMLFVPSRGGRSHCLEEWTEYENLQKGIELVYHTVTSLEGTSDSGKARPAGRRRFSLKKQKNIHPLF